MDESTQAMLDAYRAERDALLQRATSALEHDARVVAAWLFGSLGRGEEDALSDLDLWAVVADEHIETISTQRQGYVAQLGVPLLVVEAPQNAPAGGAYLMAIYDAPTGPHPIDWYWQPQSAAQIPQQTRLLFDRVGLPRADSPTTFAAPTQPPERTPMEAASQAVSFFWAMLLITAKYAARSPHEERMGLLPYVLGPLREVERFIEAESSPGSDESSPHPRPDEKLALLRRLAHRMEALMPQVKARGGTVPSSIAPSASRYLDLITALLAGPEPEKAFSRF